MLPTPTLQQDETLIKSGAATRHGYGKSCVFALTNRRVIFKTLFSEDWFPLSHLKSIARTGIFLNIQFDNGRSTTVSTFEAEQFLALIEQAQVHAPQMEYQPVKEQSAGSFNSTRMLVVLLIAGALIGMCFLVLLAMFAGFYFLS